MKPPWLPINADWLAQNCYDDHHCCHEELFRAPRCSRQTRYCTTKHQPPAGGHRSAHCRPVICCKAFLIVVVLACDSFKLVSCLEAGAKLDRARPPDRVGGSALDENTSPRLGHATHEITLHSATSDGGAISAKAAPTPPATPHFNLDKMPPAVAASSYQTEVYLPCQILNLDADQTVSWIRKRDSLVLTVDKMRLVDDARFELNQAPDDWTLMLSQPSELDAGFYECQVSSVEPKLSHLVELRMVRAESAISNFSSLYVRPNDLVNLTCSIRAPQATNYVYWYKNKDVVQFDNLRAIGGGGARTGETRQHRQRQLTGELDEAAPSAGHPSSSRARFRRETQRQRQRAPPSHQARPQLEKPASRREHHGATVAATNGAASSRDRQEEAGEADGKQWWSHSSSTLIIREAQLNDTANYTCLPSNAKPAQIRVVVIENGLGSQPEKRSLQVDGASRCLDVSARSTWLKVRLLYLYLLDNFRDIMDTGLGLYTVKRERSLDMGVIQGFNSEETNSLLRILIDIVTDDNTICWLVTTVVSVYIVKLDQ